MPSLQLIIVAIYFAILFCVGAWASRLIGDATDFLLAGRRLGLVLATATLCATHFGGGFVMGSGERGFSHGVTGLAYAVGVGLSLVLLGLVAARKMRRLAKFTVPDYLLYRYNSKTLSTLPALRSPLTIVGIIGDQICAAKPALSIIGLHPAWAAVIATLLSIAYTALSGLSRVTLSYAIQLAIIFIGIPLATFMAASA